jgi:hypothetical protein
MEYDLVLDFLKLGHEDWELSVILIGSELDIGLYQPLYILSALIHYPRVSQLSVLPRH